MQSCDRSSSMGYSTLFRLGRGMYLGPYDYRLSLGSEWGLKRLCGRREGQPGAHPR